MKNHLYTFIIAGGASLCMNSCNERPDQVNAEIEAEIINLSTISQDGQTRKVWPPVSEKKLAEQTIDNYLVVLDDSGSMSGQKLAQAKEALLLLADKLDPKDNLGLILLNRKLTVPLATNNRESFKQQVNSATASGGTPLSKSTALAYKEITQQASRQQGYGSYHVIIVTDGESSDGSPMALVKTVVNTTSVQFHVVGFHVDNHGMNNPHYVDYRTARNSAELIKAFEEVAAETEEFSDPKEFSN